ncbi:hypothetical protein Zmor_012202 [Zophobas morio]|uniref:CSD domain-containing protein n=1 Tax=Zophobas morio TaxID=2755281 RepID=A0AA38HIK4_9CUCU|nr:hypothetical protein Zmor_012202 [Zophobas morio]
MSVQCGTCKWFDVRKGFGFITPDKGGPDLFCHQTSLKSQGFRALAEGERVEFTVEIDGTGRAKAVNVTGPDGVDCQGPQRRHFPSRDNYYDDHAYKPSNGFSSPSYRSGGPSKL